MAHEVFVSYSHHDKPQADAVCATLEAKGIRCWIAPRDVIPGQEWGAAIVNAIRSARVMVLVFSSHANASPQIRREVERAVNAETVLIPFRIEDVAPAEALEFFLGAPHWLDALTPPLDAHLERLAAAVMSFLSVSEPVGSSTCTTMTPHTGFDTDTDLTATPSTRGGEQKTEEALPGADRTEAEKLVRHPAPRVGADFGPYRLRRLLGRGTMGEVYEAENSRTARIVAVRVLSATVSSDPIFRARLQREARATAKLQEPHVLPIHDFGEIDGVMYVEMRLIDGMDLRTMLKRYGQMTPTRAVAIIGQVASALDSAHAIGVMHRDLKPENILITRDDFAYVNDFGILNAATDEKSAKLGTVKGLGLQSAGAVHQRRGNVQRRHLCTGLCAIRVPDRVSAISDGQHDRCDHRTSGAADSTSQRGASGHS